ncbi:MAG: hypothetical protein ACK48K_17110, partial [Planctomycetota bacterium]
MRNGIFTSPLCVFLAVENHVKHPHKQNPGQNAYSASAPRRSRGLNLPHIQDFYHLTDLKNLGLSPILEGHESKLSQLSIRLLFYRLPPSLGSEVARLIQLIYGSRQVRTSR